MNDTTTTTGTLTLFSLSCDERGSEYGHLYIVAASSQSEAEDIILADIRFDESMPLAEVRDEHGFKVYGNGDNAIGTTEYGDGPRVVSCFRT